MPLIVVTSGAGYFGSVAVPELIAAGVREFILSSTASLFDRPEKIPIIESEAFIPGSPYGEAKHYLELFCIGWSGFMGCDS